MPRARTGDGNAAKRPARGGTFVGFDNYARLFADSNFIRSVLNTFALALMIVPLLTVISLSLALALNRATRGAAVFRGIFFSSSVLSVTIVTLIWRFVLAPDAGLMGEIAQGVGAEPIPFLSHPTWSLWALALTTIWWSIVLPMLLFLAGLQQIPGRGGNAVPADRAAHAHPIRHHDARNGGRAWPLRHAPAGLRSRRSRCCLRRR